MDIDSEFVHLARLAISGENEDVHALVRRTFRTLLKRRPDLSERAKDVLEGIGNTNTVRGYSTQPLPVDTDSRLELLRREMSVELDEIPVWPDEVGKQLQATVDERDHIDELLDAGLNPTRSLLLVGPPGVGKTLAARWLAQQLSYPLLTLDLAGVMSSFLGRTGNNIRVVLDYARRTPSVLLLDEFDAIAKRRDDVAEIGELKRLVTVLLQAVDDWPANGLLVAATNHAELLDPAVWRRFDRKIFFPLPTASQLETTIRHLLGPNVEGDIIQVFGLLFQGESFAEVVRTVTLARREAILKKSDVSHVLLEIARERNRTVPKAKRMEIADKLLNLGFSQRHVSEITGIARDTIRTKHSVTKSIAGKEI